MDDLFIIVGRLLKIENNDEIIRPFIVDLRMILTLSKNIEKYKSVIDGIVEYLAPKIEPVLDTSIPKSHVRKCDLCGQKKHYTRMFKVEEIKTKGERLFFRYRCLDCKEPPMPYFRRIEKYL